MNDDENYQKIGQKYCHGYDKDSEYDETERWKRK